jgi:hypothetical protein
VTLMKRTHSWHKANSVAEASPFRNEISEFGNRVNQSH